MQASPRQFKLEKLVTDLKFLKELNSKKENEKLKTALKISTGFKKFYIKREHEFST